MRANVFVFSLIILILCFGLFALGIISLLIPHLHHLREALVEGIVNQKQRFTWIGGGLLGLSCTLLTIFYWLNQRRYLLIRMGGRGIAIEDSVVRRVVQQLFEEHFPSEKIHCEVAVRKKKKIEIFVDLPSLDNEQKQISTLESLERHLEKAFVNFFGYHHEFLLNVQFITKKALP